MKNQDLSAIINMDDKQMNEFIIKQQISTVLAEGNWEQHL